MDIDGEKIRVAFAKVKADIECHAKLIQKIGFESASLRKDALRQQSSILEKIASLDLNIKRKDASLRRMDGLISTSLSKADPIKNEMILSILDAQKAEIDHLKLEIKNLSVFNGLPRLNEPARPIINADNANNINIITTELNYNGLTNPEKWLVGVLLGCDSPISYAQISGKTGKTVSTVRVYMNQLKLKGFIDESSLPNGTKIFSIKHEAKVKALYNV
jgi:hypothetical protein